MSEASSRDDLLSLYNSRLEAFRRVEEGLSLLVITDVVEESSGRMVMKSLRLTDPETTKEDIEEQYANSDVDFRDIGCLETVQVIGSQAIAKYIEETEEKLEELLAN